MRCQCQLKIFWASGHQWLNFDGFIYIRYAAPPYSAGTVCTVASEVVEKITNSIQFLDPIYREGWPEFLKFVYVDRSLYNFWLYRKPLAVCSAHPQLSTSCFIQKLFAVKFDLKSRSRRKTSKMGSIGAPIIEGRGYPKFWTCIFKSHSFPICGRFWLNSVNYSFDDKKIDRRIAVKLKSGNNYVGRPNKFVTIISKKTKRLRRSKTTMAWWMSKRQVNAPWNVARCNMCPIRRRKKSRLCVKTRGISRTPSMPITPRSYRS